MRLPWWGLLCVGVAAFAVSFLFDHFGKFALAVPSLTWVLVVAFAVALRWRLRHRAWFWITMVLLAALHLPLILFVPWTTKWIPAAVITSFAMVDLWAILWVLSVVGEFVERPQKTGR